MEHLSLFRKLGKLTLGLAVGLSLWGSAQAQISDGGTPPSRWPGAGFSPAPTINMAKVDVQALRAEDAQLNKDPRNPQPFRMGVPLKVYVSSRQHGVWTTTPDGDKVWRVTISSPGATTMSMVLDRFLIPNGALLYVLNKEGNRYIGGFSNKNQQPGLGLAIAPLFTDQITLEYVEPAGSDFSGEIAVGRVIHGYKSADEIKAFGSSGACNLNVNCPAGANFQDQKRAVAMIVDGGGGACTGAMINTVGNDGTPYFLSANHCGSDPSNWVFWFNWESPNCNNPAVDPANQQTVSGAVNVARNAASDFALHRFNQRPPDSYNVFMAGWNRSRTPATSGVSIHHPSGDIKKITPFNTRLTAAPYPFGTSRAGTWRVTWASGTTEGGSSGSPLFDNNGRIIGQLFGGTASCTNRNDPDYYGRFYNSWDSSATATQHLKTWLDPQGTDSVTKNGAYLKCLPTFLPLPIVEPFNVAGLPSGWENAGAVAWGTRNVNAYGGTGFSMSLRSKASNPAPGVGGRSELSVRAYDFTRVSNAQLHWDYAYPTAANLRDTLEVYISTDCGSTFTLLTTRFSADLGTTAGPVVTAYSPSAAEWKHDSIAIPAGAEGSRYTRIKFVSRRASGTATNNLYLDNISIRGMMTVLRPRAAFTTASGSDGCAPVSFTLQDASQEGPTSYSWSFPGAVVDTSTAVNPTVTYTRPGSYDVKLVVRNSAGADSITRVAFFKVIGKDSLVAPYIEEFDNPAFPPNRWSLKKNTTLDSTWRWANRIGATTLPSGCAALNNYTTNNIGAVDYLISPSFDLSVVNRPVARIHYAYREYTQAPDTLQLAYSTDCGTTWNTLWSASGAGLATVTGTGTGVFAPSTLASFKFQTVPLPANVAGSSDVRFAIVNRGGFGQFVYVNSFAIDTGNTCPATPLVTGATTLCAGDSMVLSVDPVVTGVNYSWTGPNAFTATTPRIVIRNIAANAAGAYSVTASNQAGTCSSSPVVRNVVVNARPARPSVRTGTSDTLLSSLTASPRYIWYFNGVVIPGANGPRIKADSAGSYAVAQVNANGCTSLVSNPLNYTPLSIGSGVLSQVSTLYPNPNTGEFVLKLPVLMAGRKAEVVILNHLGQEVRRSTELLDTDASLHMSLKLTQGMYMMHATISGEKVLKSFVVR